MKKQIVLLTFAFITASCGKAFLEKKPRSSFIIPETLTDYQQLLDNGNVMFMDSELPEVLADNYYLKMDYWQSLSSPLLRNAHIWGDKIYEDEETTEAWNAPYRQIFYANVVLDGITDLPITTNNEQEWKRIKGSAHFIRAYALHNLAQLFAPVYRESTADAELGLPILKTSDVNQPITRASVRKTYQQILDDLHEAENFLTNERDYARPSRPAVYAQLARVYLTMQLYENAGEYADKCLKDYDTLVDFNELTQTTYSVRDEAIYLNYMNQPAVIMSPTHYNTLINPELYDTYEEDDRRKVIYYRLNANNEPYKGLSHLFSYQFSGLATDEMFLIRAEAHARAGEVSQAMEDLNHLLRYRWETGTYIDKTATNQYEALKTILIERRKELAFRNLRWSDIRRLNAEGANIELYRTLGSENYTLRPGDVRWVLPIPPNELRSSGIEPNP